MSKVLVDAIISDFRRIRILRFLLAKTKLLQIRLEFFVTLVVGGLMQTIYFVLLFGFF